MATFGDFDPADDATGGTLDDVDPDAAARILFAELHAQLPRRFRLFDNHVGADRVRIALALERFVRRLADEVGP